MSFLKITDPSKRARIVDEYLKLKKSIQQNSLSEKLGDSDLQRDLIKLYKPITESQAEIAKELTDTSTVLKALPASISTSLQTLMPAVPEAIEYPSIETSQDPVESIRRLEYGEFATKYLLQHGGKSKKDVDTTFGIYSKDGQFYIGPTEITIQGDDVTVGEKTYAGTRGLWELLTMSNPVNYNSEDRNNYKNILIETKAMSQNTDKLLYKPKSSKSAKYKEIIKPMWDEWLNSELVKTRRTEEKLLSARKTTGKGVAAPIILPSDTNTLVKMFKLRMDAYNAGNTGVADEVIAICDELLRQGVIDKERYKEFMVYLSQV